MEGRWNIFALKIDPGFPASGFAGQSSIWLKNATEP